MMHFPCMSEMTKGGQRRGGAEPNRTSRTSCGIPVSHPNHSDPETTVHRVTPDWPAGSLPWCDSRGPEQAGSEVSYHNVTNLLHGSRKCGFHPHCLDPCGRFINNWKYESCEHGELYIETQRETHSVSGGQCHLIRLTILRRFSWPSFAYIYVHKGGVKPHSFHFILHQSPRPITTRNIIQPNS